MSLTPIPIIDLFAGPGGLGEGFSSVDDGKAFRIAVSAEKDPIAHQTLKLRAFYRLLCNENPAGLEDYYRFCQGKSDSPYGLGTRKEWLKASQEALCIELGSPAGNQELDVAIAKALGASPSTVPWVLIGGPPCQAYSLVGRSRNKGKIDYSPEKDHRHFLYREYLRVIQQYQPAVFVMENVKGILSSTVHGRKIFRDILNDLVNPNRALGVEVDGHKYHICSLVSDQKYSDGDDFDALDSSRFIIRSEDHGIPQARHRVILLGIREDFYDEKKMRVLRSSKEILNVKQAIGQLPALRSRLTKMTDSPCAWQTIVRLRMCELAKSAQEMGKEEIALKLLGAVPSVKEKTHFGGLVYPKEVEGSTGNGLLDDWLLDKRLGVWLNHEARGHMADDLGRYAFAAAFAKVHGRSPKGHEEFDLPGLSPAHKNWESGKFSDRFRVQTEHGPSTTITSHISKDGHYFIHYDVSQCRSLTVREAARLQTFPDNYFFQGGRTQQFHQVGNAVPPFLAYQIGEVVRQLVL